jgi:hypothetical protein
MTDAQIVQKDLSFPTKLQGPGWWPKLQIEEKTS